MIVLAVYPTSNERKTCSVKITKGLKIPKKYFQTNKGNNLLVFRYEHIINTKITERLPLSAHMFLSLIRLLDIRLLDISIMSNI